MTDKPEGLTTAEAEVIKQTARILELEEERDRRRAKEIDRLLYVLDMTLKALGGIDGVRVEYAPSPIDTIHVIWITLPNV